MKPLGKILHSEINSLGRLPHKDAVNYIMSYSYTTVVANTTIKRNNVCQCHSPQHCCSQSTVTVQSVTGLRFSAINRV